MKQVALKQISFGGISLQIPEVWNTITETYTEPDGRECTMIEISAEEGDPRSIIISYGWKSPVCVTPEAQCRKDQTP